jgi:hypothetical protein
LSGKEERCRSGKSMFFPPEGGFFPSLQRTRGRK